MVLLISFALGLRNEPIRDSDLYLLKVPSFVDREDSSNSCDVVFIFFRAWLKLSSSEWIYMVQ